MNPSVPDDNVDNKPQDQAAPQMRAEIMKMSVPVILSHFVLTIGTFISSLMLSEVDQNNFAAGILVSTLQLAVISVFFGVLYAMSAIVGKVAGEKTHLGRVGEFWLAGIAAAFMLAVPMIAIFANAGSLFGLLKQPPELVALSKSYFDLYVFAVPGAAIALVIVQLLLGVAKQGIALLYSIFSIVVSMFLSYVFIFGKFGAEPMGIAGLAMGTLVTTWMAVALLVSYLLKSKDLKPYFEGISVASLSPARVREIFRVGGPIAVQMGNEILSLLVTTIMVGWISVEALSAHQVTTRYLMLLVIPVIGISQSATVLIARHFGAGQYQLLPDYGKTLMKMGLAYSSFILVLFVVIPEPLIGIFVDKSAQTAATYELIKKLLIIVAIGQVFDSLRNISTGALRGLQDTKFPMQVSFVLIWLVGIPLAYVLGFIADLGLLGIAVAHNVAMASAGAILYLRWRGTLANTLAENGEVCLKAGKA